jgi:hypothetical protein
MSTTETVPGELLDPVTGLVLHQPLLASDGVTYSADTIRAAMAADCLHRSPVTGEVLRRWAFPNVIADNLLALYQQPGAARSRQTPGTVFLWPEAGDADAEGAPPPGITVHTITVPSPASVEVMACLWDIGVDLTSEAFRGCRIALVSSVMIHGSGAAWLVQPPPPEALWDVATRLCRVLAGRSAFANPWCFSGSRVRVNDKDIGSVEDLWIQKSS